MTNMAASGDWKTDVLPLAGAFALATMQKVWSSYQSHRGETWPISYGRVLNVAIESQARAATLKLSYSYSVGNESYGGKFKKVFQDGDEADAWKDALSGKQIPVRYDPGKPSRSRLTESDLRPMVQAFAPAPTAADVQPMPWWKRALCQLGLALAIIGFGLCVVESVAEKMGHLLLGRGVYGWLMLGAVVMPLISIYGTYGDRRRAWRALPEWMKYLGFVVIFYSALAAFLPHHSVRDQRIRQSGRDITYQLAGYLGAIEVLYARLRSDPQHEDYLQRSLSSGVKIG